MVQKFQHFLRKEIYKLVQNNGTARRRTHRPKQHSEANISVSSSQAKGMTYDVDMEYLHSMFPS